MLKPLGTDGVLTVAPQPPSGGCVLKLSFSQAVALVVLPAAFGRLCVETTSMLKSKTPTANQPPSGGCVLKHQFTFPPTFVRAQPPSGGCVLKQPLAL